MTLQVPGVWVNDVLSPQHIHDQTPKHAPCQERKEEATWRVWGNDGIDQWKMGPWLVRFCQGDERLPSMGITIGEYFT